MLRLQNQALIKELAITRLQLDATIAQREATDAPARESKTDNTQLCQGPVLICNPDLKGVIRR
jgi:hypothetical protein